MLRTEPLAWHDCTPQQARGVLRRNDIDAKLFTVALGRFGDPDYNVFGASVFLFDMATGKAARVTVQGLDEYDVKVSGRTQDELWDDLVHQYPTWALDEIVVMG